MDERVLDRVRGYAHPTGAARQAVVVKLLRGVTAAGVLLSADIHLSLYADGYAGIPVIGPLFIVNLVAGLAIGLAVLVVRHWLVLFAAAGFGVVTLAAFVTSVTVGLFGLHEVWDALAVLAVVAEGVAVVGAASSWLLAVRANRRV